MRRVLKVTVILMTMGALLGPCFAQERVESLTRRQVEIEDSIRNSIQHYLNSQDYVLKVWLKGDRKTGLLGSSSKEVFQS